MKNRGREISVLLSLSRATGLRSLIKHALSAPAGASLVATVGPGGLCYMLFVQEIGIAAIRPVEGCSTHEHVAIWP